MTFRQMTGNDVFPVLAGAGRESLFLRDVYGWMCGGLAVTALTAWLVAGSEAVVNAMASNSLVFWAFVIAQLAIVFLLSARVNTLAASTASLLFVCYSALTGVTLSMLLLVFTGESIATTFVVTAGMFGGLALYGTVTPRSLAGAGQFLFMGLIGIVLASVVGLFWHSDALQFLIAVAGIVVFTGLTAYDAQRLKAMAQEMPSDRLGAYAVVGALALYLDFVNLFLSLLRFFGRRRR